MAIHWVYSLSQFERILETELEDWATLGVEGHMEGRNPWYYYHHFVEEASAQLLGAKKEEVVVMNALTVNLNLMMVSFYRPTKSRYKILMEAQAFPSDQYAAEMQARFHGLDPADAVVELPLRDGEHTHRTEDILAKIEELGDSLALVLIGGVNYYTGQLFDMQKITAAGSCSRCKCRFRPGTRMWERAVKNARLGTRFCRLVFLINTSIPVLEELAACLYMKGMPTI